MIKFLTFLIIYRLSLGKNVLPVIGPNSQDCTPPDDDNDPDECPITRNEYTSLTGSIIECEEDFDCCTCASITCGISTTKPCEKFVANGDKSAFYVGPIIINGNADDGADIDCNGDHSCAGTKISGYHIQDLKCSGDKSCAYAEWLIYCSADGCKAECDGDMSCIDASMQIENVKSVACGSEFSCAYATIVVNNPKDDFELECGGVGSCEGLRLTVNIPKSSTVTELKGINCASEDACLEAEITINNYSPNVVEIEEINCEASGGCERAMFSFTGLINIDECKCSDKGCFKSVGLKSCGDNIYKLECKEDECMERSLSIVNPGKDFELICDGYASCNNFDLTVIINNNADDYPIESLKGVKCAKDKSCYGLNYNIVNQQSGVRRLSVDKIECDGEDSCIQARFRGNGAENVFFEEIKCDGNCGVKNTLAQCLVESGGMQMFCGDIESD